MTTYILTVVDVLFGGPIAFSGGREVAILVASISSPVRSTSLVLGLDLGLVFGFNLLLLSAPIQALLTITLAAAACLGVGFR